MGQTFYQTNFCFLFCPYTVYNTFFQSYITLQINRRKKFLLLKQNPKSTKFNLCITNNCLTMQCWYIVWLTYVEIFLTIFFIVTWSLFISFVFVKASFLLDRIFWEERNYFSCNPNRFFFCCGIADMVSIFPQGIKIWLDERKSNAVTPEKYSA